MADWSASMQQTFEYYIVDPVTWRDKKQITDVISCNINRDSEAETLGSATIDIGSSVGEAYIRAYLITIQNGVKEKHPLGTFLVQTPSTGFDGKAHDISMDAYTPLLELKENPPPIGYSLLKGDNVMDRAYQLAREHARAPVVKPSCSTILFDNFVANTSDTWLTFISDLMTNAKYIFELDEMGRILFSPKQEMAALQPVWTYDDGNSSILHPSITEDHDLYGIPNVVEVIYSNGRESYYARVVNDDPNSPTSTVSRGREITHVVTDLGLDGNLSDDQMGNQVKEYAERLLRELSSIEHTVTYTHGYCPVRIGDCVRLNYTKAGLSNIKARVISQSIKCEPGCPVTEKAVFTVKLWR